MAKAVKKNALDKLLSIDTKAFAREQRKVEIERLSELAGEKFEVTVQELSVEDMQDIAEVTGRENIPFLYETVYRGTIDPNFSSPALKQKFSGVVTPMDAVKKVLKFNEVEKLATVIFEMSGMVEDEEDEEEDIKN